jgi:hypothetical protein
MLCLEQGFPKEEFDRAKVLLLEAGEIREEATELPPVIWLPLTEEERKEYQADLATAKANETYLALKRIQRVTIMPDRDDIALLHVSANDWDKLVARAAVLRQRNARKGE